jgi:D-sedoheptulose 7-phosphate isomerase
VDRYFHGNPSLAKFDDQGMLPGRPMMRLSWIEEPYNQRDTFVVRSPRRNPPAGGRNCHGHTLSVPDYRQESVRVLAGLPGASPRLHLLLRLATPHFGGLRMDGNPPALRRRLNWLLMTFAEQYRTQLLDVIRAIDVEKVERAIEILNAARREGRRIFVFGNGGSASAASHFATDMVKGASFGRGMRFRIMALTDSLPTITAYSNDVSYECIFVEQLKNFAEPGDVAIAISGSGNSPNVLRAIEYAREIGCRTIAFSGRDGGKLGPLAELNLQVAHPHMGRIEDAHLIMLHMIGYYFMEADTAYTTA